MKQVEFETRLNALKAEMNSELEAIEKWQVDIKQRVADAHRQRTHYEGEVSRLKAERQGLAARRNEVERKWKTKIAQFKAENYSEERMLADMSDFALAKELARRGWHGDIWNEREDMEQEHKENVTKAFNASYAEAEADND